MIYMTSKLPQTFPRHSQIWSRLSQTPTHTIQTLRRHNPDTPRHRRFYAIQSTGIKDNIWISWPNIICLPTDLVLIHPQTPSYPIQTTSRHPRTQSRHPQTKAFLFYTDNLPFKECPILHKYAFFWGCLDGVWGCQDGVWMGSESVWGYINSRMSGYQDVAISNRHWQNLN